MARDTVQIWLDSVSGGTGAVTLDAQVENDEDICSFTEFVSLCSGGKNGYYRDLKFGPESPDRRFFHLLALHNKDTNAAGDEIQTNLANRLTRADIEIYSDDRIRRNGQEWPKYMQMRTHTDTFSYVQRGINYSENLGEIELVKIDYDNPNYASFQGFINFHGRPVTGFRLWVTCWGRGGQYISSSGHEWQGYLSAANVKDKYDPVRPRFYSTGAMLKGLYAVAFDLEIAEGEEVFAEHREWWEPVLTQPDTPGMIESAGYFAEEDIQRWIDEGRIQFADVALTEDEARSSTKWVARHLSSQCCKRPPEVIPRSKFGQAIYGEQGNPKSS